MSICTFNHLFVVTRIFFCFCQVQEKKIKKICNFNVEPQKQTINGFNNSSNVPMSSKACSSNRITSLRLPMVVVCSLSFFFLLLATVNCLFVYASTSTFPIQITCQETNLLARCRRTYAHAHDYHINSISNNRCA